MKARYEIRQQPSLTQVLGYVRDDVREMECKKLDKHTIMVAKADVIDIVNDWIAYCHENWPPLKGRSKTK